MRVKLSSMPDPKSLSSVQLSNLWGGLNLRDDPVNIPSYQSPNLYNMWYQDGVLRKRPGLKAVLSGTDTDRASGQVWFYNQLFNGLVVYVDGSYIRYFDPADSDPVRKTVSGTKIPANNPHGTFFAFDERLYYKAKDVYLRLSYADGALAAENILYKGSAGYYTSDAVYTPIIAINRNPDGSGGDLYQPENRINPKKEVWFDIDKTSYDYYLPVHGCRVNKIRVGDSEIATTSSTRTFALDGRTITIYDEDIPDTSSNYTRIHFSVPLYINKEQWSDQTWVGSTSLGWNYLPNVTYSNFSLKATENTEFKGGTMLHPADSGGVPHEYSATLLDRALALCPYTDKSKVFVFDNGIWCNIFILSPSFSVQKYNPDNTEMWMYGYFRVAYEYAKDEWTTYDFSGKSNNGWHYAKNAIYSTVDVYYGDTKIVSKGGPIGEHTTFTESYSSLALKYSGLTSSDTYKLLWISQNSDIVVFHYLVGSSRFYITNYHPDNGWFQGKGIRKVTIHRNNLSKVDVEDMSEPGPYGFFIKNIVWASEDIVWNEYVPGDKLLYATGTLSEADQRLVEIAKYLAKQKYSYPGYTGKFAIAKSGKYTSIYLDCGMEVKSYNLKTGEFKASDFISMVYTANDVTEGISLDLSTPASMSNQLKVTYTKDNDEAMKAIADCRFSVSYGGTDAVCVVMGRCDAQPNAIFWSGNGSYGIDATYFPMDQYNLCGTYQDPITGFGKQQSALIVFQEHHTSKASYGITEISGRKYIDLTMSTINAERGCDRPWSVALCGNNLVWMNSKYGVMYLKDTSASYENMIVSISGNVNGGVSRTGMLHDISSSSQDYCVGAEDGTRYYAFTEHALYVWDYSLSSVGDGIKSLSWTRHSTLHSDAAPSNPSPQAIVDAAPYGVYVMARTGRILKFDRATETDAGYAIETTYTTPLQDFGGYYRLCNVVKVILNVRAQKEGIVQISYGGESMDSKQQIRAMVKLQPTPIILKPRGLHLHHFQLSIDTAGSGGALEIMGITILYNTQGLSK